MSTRVERRPNNSHFLAYLSTSSKLGHRLVPYAQLILRLFSTSISDNIPRRSTVQIVLKDFPPLFFQFDTQTLACKRLLSMARLNESIAPTESLDARKFGGRLLLLLTTDSMDEFLTGI